MTTTIATTFKDFGLAPALVQAVTDLKFETPTPVQAKVIPALLKGTRDLVALAQTGTGKTAAFGLPILQKLGSHGRCRCLILEPTRELAMQVETALRDFARFTDLRVASIFGGVGYGAQRIALKDGVDG